ncbi:MAG: GNAT family N-acetyltransferase [Sediminibacterium sp.]
MIKTTETEKDGYTISTDPGKLDLQVIHQYLSRDSYWARNIPFDVVERSVANSFYFGLYHNNQQVGFARLITDKATFGYLADVFILQEHRGKGLSKWLLTVIHSHPEMQGLRRWMLGTKDAHELYKQFGWAPLSEEVVPRFMQLHTPDVYEPKTTDA